MSVIRLLLSLLLAVAGTAGVLFGLSRPAEICTQSEPCVAKEQYEKAVAKEKALNARVLANTPKGSTPNGNASEWQEICDNLKGSPEYLGREFYEEAILRCEGRIAQINREIKYLEGQIKEFLENTRSLRKRIKELESSNLTEAGKKKLLEAKQQLRHYESAISNREDSISRLKKEIRGEEATIKDYKERLKTNDLVDKLEAWIKYSKIHNEWEKADNDVEAAKADYEDGVAEKNDAIAKAKSNYDAALARLAQANKEMQGMPHDAAYNAKMLELVEELKDLLTEAEDVLDGLDCFDDVKAMRTKLQKQRVALRNVKIGPTEVKPATAPGPKPTPKPIPMQPSAPSGGGVFKLSKKEIGHVPGPDKGPYGTWSGSISESSFNAIYQTTSSYEFNVNLQANWTVPPETLRPGDTVELGVVTSGSVTGKDRGAVGLSAGWEISGSATVISNTRAFSGISESGKEFGGGSGAIKFKVGSGGTITIASNRGGVSWGSGGNFTPCVYTYSFKN